MFRFLNKNKGFTLVEMMVTALIFSVIIGSVIGIFVSAIKMQRYNLAYQQLLDQTSYAMEYMSRAIRMAVKDDGTCGFSGDNYDSGSGTKLEFRSYNPDYGCQEFSRVWNSIKEVYQLKIENNEVDDFLTSDNFNVTSLNFRISGESDTDNLQPRVTIFMEIQGKGSGYQPKIAIQTTISQRNPDF